MSGNQREVTPLRTPSKARSKLDRRVRRTRDTLGTALMELIQEKRFEAITVQEVLDRAGVGRSTFYTHYRDKDDLFLSDVEAFFEGMAAYLTRSKAPAHRVAPVAELFSHIADVRDFYKSLVAAGKIIDVKALGHGFFARSIEQRLRLAGCTTDPAKLAPQAHALAGNLFALLDWWVDHGMKTDPAQMDEIFHTMAWNGLKA